MLITRFKHDQVLAREFVDLEYRLYRNDPHWVPPLRRGRLRGRGLGQSAVPAAGTRPDPLPRPRRRPPPWVAWWQP